VYRSLGITAIELALGDPPYHEYHPMKAIFLIPTSPSPCLPSSELWSESFHEFIRMCLDKNPLNRPSSQTLLTKVNKNMQK
jgi:serine/threonine protein kinase